MKNIIIAFLMLVFLSAAKPVDELKLYFAQQVNNSYVGFEYTAVEELFYFTLDARSRTDITEMDLQPYKIEFGGYENGKRLALQHNYVKSINHWDNCIILSLENKFTW